MNLSIKNLKLFNRQVCILKASENNQFDKVKQLIRNGAAINVRDEDGNTALHKASFGGHYEIVKLLLENRAQVNCRNDRGLTPIYNAIMNGQHSCVVVLIQGGAEVNPMPFLDLSYAAPLPLQQAAMSGHLEIVKLLIKNGANPQAKDAKAKTALHYAAMSSSKDAAEICKIFLKNGVDIDAKDRYDRSTALRIAVKDVDKCNEEVIQTLLNFGAKTESIDSDFTMTSLEYATFIGNIKAIRLLLKNGLCPLKTRRIERMNLSHTKNYSAFEIAMIKKYNHKESQNVFKTILYATSKN